MLTANKTDPSGLVIVFFRSYHSQPHNVHGNGGHGNNMWVVGDHVREYQRSFEGVSEVI